MFLVGESKPNNVLCSLALLQSGNGFWEGEGVQPADVKVFPELKKPTLFNTGLGVAIGSARTVRLCFVLITYFWLAF